MIRQPIRCAAAPARGSTIGGAVLDGLDCFFGTALDANPDREILVDLCRPSRRQGGHAGTTRQEALTRLQDLSTIRVSRDAELV